MKGCARGAGDEESEPLRERKKSRVREMWRRGERVARGVGVGR
jgi:hypothetical protein